MGRTVLLQINYLYIFHLKDSKFSQKYKKFAYQLADVVERYNLVNFVPLHVESKHLMAKLIFECDKTLGYYGQKNDKIDLSHFENYQHV